MLKGQESSIKVLYTMSDPQNLLLFECDYD